MNVFRTFGHDLTASTAGDGTAKKGQMNFAFIDMGQGDCIIISDPDNEVYVVDCGSASMRDQAHFDDAKKIVRAWAGDNSITMVVTHPDHDHYNRFLELLINDLPVVDVWAIYFSRAFSDETPLSRYRVSGFNNGMAAFGNPVIREITLNETSNDMKEWESSDNYSEPVESKIPKTGYVLASGKTPKSKDWSITIIAGNVATVQSPSSATANNVVSLCTMVKFDIEKAFLTGDSTEETLTYLYDKQRAHFQNCSIFQIPHHGSESSIPTDTFKNYVNPQSLIVSVGYATYNHKLPRNEVLQKWLTCSRLKTKSIQYDEWIYGVAGYNNTKELNAILEDDWNDYMTDNTSSFNFLTDPDDGEKSGTGFWGFTNSFYFIYRRTATKDIYTTGLYGNLIDEGFMDNKVLLNNNLATEEDGF